MLLVEDALESTASGLSLSHWTPGMTGNRGHKAVGTVDALVQKMTWPFNIVLSGAHATAGRVAKEGLCLHLSGL